MSTDFTLAREPGGDNCAKCLAATKVNPDVRQQPAVYTLRQKLQSWRLCVNHAAAASWSFGIVSSFNPAGKTRLTEGT